MATLLSALETQVRIPLKETTASYWTSAELIAHFNNGITDLWGAICDLHQEHNLTVDETNVSIAANATQFTGVPADCFRVHVIEPRDTTTSPGQQILFVPRDYKSHEFTGARAQLAQDPNSGGLKIYYTLTGAGAPVAAPTILCAPKLTSALNLRLAYIPSLAVKAAGDANPIGGGSDNALIAWCVAYALAKTREDKSPDPNWLAVYATEKQNMLTRMAPRQEQEPEIVEGVFDAYNE